MAKKIAAKLGGEPPISQQKFVNGVDLKKTN